MSFATYDPTTDVGFIRMRIGDTVAATALFSDEELNAMLSFEGDKLRASAFALETIATNQVLLLKAIKVLGLQTNGDRVGAELRLQAKTIRDQAGLIDSDTGGLFDWANTLDDDFARREYLEKDILRQAAGG